MASQRGMPHLTAGEATAETEEAESHQGTQAAGPDRTGNRGLWDTAKGEIRRLFINGALETSRNLQNPNINDDAKQKS